MAKDNHLKMTKLKTVRKIIEASGNTLDIIGETSFFVKLDVFGGKVKNMDAMVLRGNTIDREILISMGVLKQWRLIHESFTMYSHIISEKLHIFLFPKLV